jgi:hypothetical protein
MINFNITFDYTGFDDAPPEEKSPRELAGLMLLDASGRHVSFKKYNDRDINLMARKLIGDGYIRGTIINEYSCSWSRLTRKGYYLMDLISIGS